MDSLVNAMYSFKITKNQETFDNDLDSLILKIDGLSTSDPDLEWDTIKSNYSKLRYTNHLIEFYDFKEIKKFVMALSKFLDYIDTINQYYIKQLSWDEEEHSEDFSEILDLFTKSLNLNDPFEKLKTILKAYKIFIPIIEVYREEKFVEFIDDQDFLKEVTSLEKKRKRTF